MAFPLSSQARFELRRFRGPLPKIALVFVLLVPLLYGAIYLTANWDPYGRLDRLPVAVVNEDQPVDFDGDTITAGDDFTHNLVDQRDFDWHEVDAAEAERGLREGDYYLTVHVPADFSADLTSGQGDDPQRAGIELRRNDANGFVIGSITNSAQASIEQAVDHAAVEAYFKAVFANLAEIRSGMGDAADGADTLSAGLADAKSGSGELSKGAKEARGGSRELAQGAKTLSTGLGTAKQGSTDLAAGLRTLDSGSDDLATGAGQVAAGTRKLNDTVLPPLTTIEQELPKIAKDAESATERLGVITEKATGASGSVASELGQADSDAAALAEKYPGLADDPAYQRLTSRLDAASGRADEIAQHAERADTVVDRINAAAGQESDLQEKIATGKEKLTALNDGAQSVASGAKELSSGIDSAVTGANDLAGGISDAADGAAALSTGATELDKGLGTLAGGARDLDRGLGKLKTGADELADGLHDGVRRIPAQSSDEQDEAAQVLASPTDVTMVVENPATYYGKGLAPMFFSIALWVFGISVFLVVRPITGRALAGRASALRQAISGWLPIGAIAVAAGWLMLGSVWAFLGLDPARPCTTIGLVTLGAVAFSAIAHLLRTALGTPGSSILLVWLILQLTASGGTYPAAILPDFFRVISTVMPMTYLIDAFRIGISGGLTSHLVRDVVILAACAVAALALCTLAVRRRQQFSMKDLHPPLVSP